ncbi:MAG: aminotransferase class V-fold PLP-dependent enzyme [Candidatus Promineifilaceae bacterium]
MKDLFLLDPEVAFLNHGSFGATPAAVMANYQAWQMRLERQPVRFFVDELFDALAQARAALGELVGAAAGDLVFVPNVTYAVNAVIRSLKLGPADEVLLTDHEYGACERAWEFYSRRRGFSLVRQHLPLPLPLAEEVVELLWQAVTPRTRLIYFSHITSATAQILPAAAICGRARAEGLLSLVDGAHTVGQLALNMAALGADFYMGNCHKWLCSPKGSAFLYARPDVQPQLEPLVVSWGWGDERAFSLGSDFLDYLQFGGTDDFAAYLAVPAAIRFQAEHGWPAVQAGCHALLGRALERLAAFSGLPGVYPEPAGYCQMAIAPLAPIADVEAFQGRFYERFRVEAPFPEWNGRQFVRVCIQAYNTWDDVERLLAGLVAMGLPGA